MKWQEEPYDTRYKNVPNIQKHATVQYNSRFLCRSVAEYAKLPVELTSIHKTSLFTKKLKADILKNYQSWTYSHLCLMAPQKTYLLMDIKEFMPHIFAERVINGTSFLLYNIIYIIVDLHL